MGVAKGKCPLGFHCFDVVHTPTHRRAQLQALRKTDGYWDAKYVTALGEVTGEEVILNPRHIRTE